MKNEEMEILLRYSTAWQKKQPFLYFFKNFYGVHSGGVLIAQYPNFGPLVFNIDFIIKL